MSVNQPAAGAAQVDDAPPSKERLSNILKFFNVVNALFLAITGIVSFLIIKPNFSQVLCACYVIFFSLLLLCFECHMSCLDAVIYRNFGFMFNWGGRLIFLFLNGVLAFSLDIMGYVAGGFTGLVICINMFILCRYRDFGEQYEHDFASMRDQAAGKPAKANTSDDRVLQAVVTASAQSQSGFNPPSGGGGSAYSGSGMGGALVNAAVANPDAAVAIGSGALTLARDPAVQAAAANQNPFLDSGAGGGGGRSELTEANGWKKFLDDKSGKYYFYSERTKETKWDTED